MAKKKINSTSAMLVDIIVKGIQEKKGQEITIMNLSTVHNSMFDYFIICNGNSRTQTEAIADAVQEEVRKAIGATPRFKEGFINSEWILLDYFDIVVHIFQKETRAFYQLEKLWADAEVKIIEDID
jgi:ribosome-associated protein